MKHLKKFEGNEFDIIEIVKTVKDICLELSDSGLKVKVESPGDTRVKTILIDISAKAFRMDDISDTYERIKDYTSQYGFKSNIKFRSLKDFANYKLPEPSEVLTSFGMLLQKPPS